jgi:hypothetical protein
VRSRQAWLSIPPAFGPHVPSDEPLELRECATAAARLAQPCAPPSGSRAAVTQSRVVDIVPRRCVVVRREIDDGAALARGTRDADASRTRRLDSDGARAHANPAKNGSNCERADGCGEGARAQGSVEAAALRRRGSQRRAGAQKARS